MTSYNSHKYKLSKRTEHTYIMIFLFDFFTYLFTYLNYFTNVLVSSVCTIVYFALLCFAYHCFCYASLFMCECLYFSLCHHCLNNKKAGKRYSGAFGRYPFFSFSNVWQISTLNTYLNAKKRNLKVKTFCIQTH